MAFKINLHITEKCNYHCKYCFAHFDGAQDLPVEDWKTAIDNIRRSGLVDAINFAGGEPVLYAGFPALVDYAYTQGFRLSIISNGSLLLNQQLMPPSLFRKMDALGISVDSVNPSVLRKLGCCDYAGNVLDYERLKELLAYAKKENPHIRIKLNTVVNRLNLEETLTTMEEEFAIDRWKFLRMKEFHTEDFSNRDLLIQGNEFDAFMGRNRRKRGESIQEADLTHSYIVVDNHGNLLDNAGENYRVIGNLLIEDFRDVFTRYPLDEEIYKSRYTNAAA